MANGEGVLLSTDARAAWLRQLAALVGAEVDVARTAVTATVGPMQFTIGVRVAPGTGGHPVLTLWAELALEGRAGARVRLAADLLPLNRGVLLVIGRTAAGRVFWVERAGLALDGARIRRT